MNGFFEKHVLHNWKIKSYAFGVSLILWFVILGQRSLIVSRSVNLDYLVSPGVSVTESTKEVTMTISAKRSVLQSFKPQDYAPVIDLRGLPPGSKRLPIKLESIQMPLGAKLLSIKPKVITLYLKNKLEKPKNKSKIKNLESEN